MCKYSKDIKETIDILRQNGIDVEHKDSLLEKDISTFQYDEKIEMIHTITFTFKTPQDKVKFLLLQDDELSEEFIGLNEEGKSVHLGMGVLEGGNVLKRVIVHIV